MAPRPGCPGRPDRGHHRGGDLVRRGSRRRRRRGGDRDGGWRRGGRHASVRRGRCRSRGLRGRVPVGGGGRLGADRDGRARLFRAFRGEPRPELRERGALRWGWRGRVGPVVLIPVEIFLVLVLVLIAPLGLLVLVQRVVHGVVQEVAHRVASLRGGRLGLGREAGERALQHTRPRLPE
jgi:hypothetical protein